MANIVKKAVDAVVVQEERPSWIPEGDTTGTDMSADDIRLPRLVIAQATSPQMLPNKSEYMEDLKTFQLFNDLTKTIYGRGPLKFIPILHEVRALQFKPQSEGGGVLHFDIPLNDPRLKWTKGENGEPDSKPLATKFHDYVILLVHDDQPYPEPIMFSIAQKNKFNRKAATDLNGFIALRHPKFGKLPIYAKMYTLETGIEQGTGGSYGVPIIRQAGIVTDEKLGREAMELAKSLKGKNIVVDREPGDDDFDTAKMDGLSM